MDIYEAKDLLNKSAKIIQRELEETVISSCEGRIIAEDITAPFSVPSFPKSAMDGYAVKAQETKGASKDNPVTFKVTGELFAGDYKDIEHKPETAVRVMTGAYVPKGYDAVVKQEDTDYGEDSVKIFKEAGAFSNYCKVGEDIAQGDLVIAKGTLLKRAHIGMLASLGIDKVLCKPLPIVGIISTGSELTMPGDNLLPGKIYASISSMLEATLEKYGIKYYSALCGDDASGIESKIREFLSICDVVITTGGVSVGKKDLIPDVIESIGAKKIFKGVNIKPGTPTMASVTDGKVILSLSGNPYAALCNFDYYFWDLLSTISENESYKSETKTAVLACDYTKIEKQTRMLRGRYDKGKVSLEKVNASSVISNLDVCNCYVFIEPGKEYKTGDKVSVLIMK